MRSFSPESDLIVLSHLRWDWVWQRPQHLISRIAGHRGTTYFVEEPVPGPVTRPVLRSAPAGPVRRMWLEVPDDGAPAEFGSPCAEGYGEALAATLGHRVIGADVWLYGPTALPFAEALAPRLLIYDMMDDVASFADGGEHVRSMQHRALHRADLVFTGGRSLFRTAVSIRGEDGTHLFPSGVEIDHYTRSRLLRGPRRRPAAGYVGVIDERLDLGLVADLAARLDDWDIHLIGPVTKIDPATLPQAPNLHYRGMWPYAQLPEAMAELDVALMPFALNDATRSISPTKTLEYLAAGLPVVSTRVPDVVADWSSVVCLADDGAGFAEACRQLLRDPIEERDARVAPLRVRHEWDSIAGRMLGLMREASAVRTTAEVPA